MKKTLLTLVAVGFGVSVSFAQTTGTEVEQSAAPAEQTDNMYQGEDKTKVEMSEVPVAVQDAFKNGEYSEYEVLAVYEKDVEGEGVKYEFELAEATAAVTEGQEAPVTEEAGTELEIEEVSNRQPDLILSFDENGQILEEKSPEEKMEE